MSRTFKLAVHDPTLLEKIERAAEKATTEALPGGENDEAWDETYDRTLLAMRQACRSWLHLETRLYLVVDVESGTVEIEQLKAEEILPDSHYRPGYGAPQRRGSEVCVHARARDNLVSGGEYCIECGADL